MLRLCLGVSIVLALTATARAGDTCPSSYTVRRWEGQRLIGLFYAERDGHELVIWRNGEELLALAVGAPGVGNPLPPRMLVRGLVGAPDGFVLLAAFNGSMVVQRLDDEGRARGPSVTVGNAGQVLTQASIVADDTGFVVAWTSGLYNWPQDLWVARLDLEATLVAEPVLHRTLRRLTPPTVALATDGGTTWLAWHDREEFSAAKSDERSYAVRIGADAAAAGPELLLGPGNMMALGQREGRFLAVLDADINELSAWNVDVVPVDGQPTDGRAHTVSLQRNFGLALVSDAAGFTLYSSTRDATLFPRSGGVGLVGLTPEGAPREAPRFLSVGADAALGFDGQQLRLAFIADRATGTKGVSRIEVGPVGGSTPVIVGAETQLEQVEVELCDDDSEQNGCTVTSGTRPSSSGLGVLLVACALLWAWRRRAGSGARPSGLR